MNSKFIHNKSKYSISGISTNIFRENSQRIKSDLYNTKELNEEDIQNIQEMRKEENEILNKIKEIREKRMSIQLNKNYGY